MNRKALLFGTVLAASMAVVAPAQAHDDFDYPLGLMSGVLLGIYLDGPDHYRDHRHPYYHHREYRRHESHGRLDRGRFNLHRDHGRDRWDRDGHRR